MAALKHRRPDQLPRCLGACSILLVLLCAPLWAAPAAAQGAEPIDLAAMALTPWDLADAGLENWGHTYSQMYFPDEFVDFSVSDGAMSEDEARDFIDDTGFLRAYYAYFYEEQQEENVVRAAVSYLYEFADEDGAADAFAFFQDAGGGAGAESLDGFDDLGDESEATLLTGEDPDTGDSYADIEVSVLLGKLHVGVSVVEWNAGEPDEDVVRELIGYALERVEDGYDAQQPALANQALRLRGDTVTTSYDTYVLRDREAIWFSGETPESADDLLDAATAAGQTEQYRVWQQLDSWGDKPQQSVWFYLSLHRFEDDSAAEEFIATHQEQLQDDTSFSFFAGSDSDFGDGGFAYFARSGDGSTSDAGVIFRFGELVAAVALSSGLLPPEESVEALAGEQLACLEDEDCPAAIDLPREVERFIADAQSSGDEAEGTPDDARGDDEREVYESETWDYTVTRDPNLWTRRDTIFPDNVFLVLDEESNTLITITGEEASNADPAACVEESADTMNRTTADDLCPTDDMPAPETVDGAAGGVYAAGDDLLFYEECRVLVEGEAVLQIGYRSDEQHREKYLPDLEVMLASIEIRTG